MQIEWDARWSGGMKECAVLRNVEDGEVLPQRDFARHVRHVEGGSELYRAEVGEGDIVLFLYLSGSGKTQTAGSLYGTEKGPWESWDEAESDLGLPEGSLHDAFWEN